VTLLLVALEIVVRITRAAETCPKRFSNSGILACDPILHFSVMVLRGLLE
jgi:hypothetical protein